MTPSYDVRMQVQRIHSRVLFTWLWSSPQFCTRNRECVQKGQKERGSLAPSEQSERGTKEQRTEEKRALQTKKESMFIKRIPKSNC